MWASPRIKFWLLRAAQIVTWICDPMHGNTETVENYKTRRYENIRAEVAALPSPAHARQRCRGPTVC